MIQRTRRRYVKKAEVLEKLRIGRNGAIQTCTEAKIDTPEYSAAIAVIDAIDDLTEALIGDRTHFHLK